MAYCCRLLSLKYGLRVVANLLLTLRSVALMIVVLLALVDDQEQKLLDLSAKRRSEGAELGTMFSHRDEIRGTGIAPVTIRKLLVASPR